MAAGSFLMLIVAVTIFGWADVWMYLSQVLPRNLEGGSVDPYNPGNATFVTLLRRLFMREPELNPEPLANSPLVVLWDARIRTVSPDVGGCIGSRIQARAGGW